MADRPEIELARLRIDREFGDGTYDDMKRRSVSDEVFARLCQEAIQKAERDLKDVKHVLHLPDELQAA